MDIQKIPLEFFERMGFACLHAYSFFFGVIVIVSWGWVDE